jgi:hypothetical protein
MKIVPENQKDKLLQDLDRVRNELLAEASSLPPEKRGEVFLGIWNVQDLIAHVIGWDFTNIQAAKDILVDHLPQFYAHHDRDWQTYNAELVRKYSKDNWDDLIAGAADSHHQLLAFLQEIPADEFERDRGIRFRGWKVTIARLLQAEAEDEATHTEQVTAFKEPIDREAVR